MKVVEAGIVPKWLNVELRQQHPGTTFLMPKISVKFQMDHADGGAKYRWGNISLYPRHGAR